MATILDIRPLSRDPESIPDGVAPEDVESVVEGSWVSLDMAGERIGVRTDETPDELAALTPTQLKALLRPLVEAQLVALGKHPHAGLVVD